MCAPEFVRQVILSIVFSVGAVISGLHSGSLVRWLSRNLAGGAFTSITATATATSTTSVFKMICQMIKKKKNEARRKPTMGHQTRSDISDDRCRMTRWSLMENYYSSGVSKSTFGITATTARKTSQRRRRQRRRRSLAPAADPVSKRSLIRLRFMVSQKKPLPDLPLTGSCLELGGWLVQNRFHERRDVFAVAGVVGVAPVQIGSETSRRVALERCTSGDTLKTSPSL